MGILRKLKKRLGIGGVNNERHLQPALRFHPIHGENIRISADGSMARRVESFCKGVVFSNRPVRINEKVYFRVAEISTSWSGVVRLGVTSTNPSTLAGALPKYACPDLTNKPGYWAKALPERYVESTSLFCYHINNNGDLILNVNGNDKGVFLAGIDVRNPLWVIMDVYGNSTAVQFIDPRASLNNARAGAAPPTTPTPQLRVRPRSEADLDLLTSMNSLNINLSARNSAAQRSSIIDHPTTFVPARYNNIAQLQPLTFHPRCRGRNIRVNADGRTARRLENEFCNGYLFTPRPLYQGESIVIQVLATETMYVGGIGFGLTSVDPSFFDPSLLPDDSDQLLDRPEYWVLSKDVAQAPHVGDELRFTLWETGEVSLSKNGEESRVFMHVDVTLPLWAFFDLYGNTQIVTLLGSSRTRAVSSVHSPLHIQLSTPCQVTGLPSNPPQQPEPSGLLQINPARPSSSNIQQLRNASYLSQQQPLNLSSTNSSYIETVASIAAAGASSLNASNECTVCYERMIDCVLYSCGHMCLCYVCAVQLYRAPNNMCPICRAPIRDVIRAYRS
uniref:RING-type E3 ubiquitin transferase n=1 Tax=Lynceus sp. MCZ IZ 141354 TaxID=1930659 RepID=A0A9N6WR00_9CRUS|nr:EOG090X03H5 [Lynceus sp. MCZ IZ 141354]